jgi:hypothetical protein
LLLGANAGNMQKEHYTEFLRLLLHIEEHQMRNDIQMYNRDDQTLKPVGEKKKLLSLKV